jgi:hypothetical protein
MGCENDEAIRHSIQQSTQPGGASVKDASPVCFWAGNDYRYASEATIGVNWPICGVLWAFSRLAG